MAIKINGKKIPKKILVAWDGCHKIYLISTKKRKEMAQNGYSILSLDQLQRVWNLSEQLRFIDRITDADEYITMVDQCEELTLDDN